MKRLFRPYLAMFVMGSILFTSCSKDGDPEPDEEGELITTMILTMIPQGGGATVTATFRDLDGPGGVAPTITPVTLAANTSYNTTITLLDETKNPAENISEEVEEEGDEHELFFVTSTGLNLTVNKTDRDVNGRPIGLISVIQTQGASSGTLRVVLKHQPGLKSSTSNINTGETDVDQTFQVTIQ